MARPTYSLAHTNSLFKDSDEFFLKTIFWNAGGLTSDKFTELKNTIIKEDIDLVGIVEAGRASENLSPLQIPGYQIYSLKRARQIASGILIFAKSSLVVKFNIMKEMTVDDMMEAAKIDIWKTGCHREFYVCYNPPNNKPDLSWLEAQWSERSILYGDLNAPSRRWGYKNSNTIGHTIEDFIDENPVQYIENQNQDPTFISTKGQLSHPDIILSHPSQTALIRHTLMYPPGGTGHKILVVNIKPKSRLEDAKDKRRTRWNTNKADWKKYSDITNEIVVEELVKGSVEGACNAVTSAILKCALAAVPRGQVKRYSPFWSKELEKLKKERDAAREQAERSQLPADRISLKQKSAALRRCVIQSKRKAGSTFLKKLDFRKDGVRTHRFVSSLDGIAGKKNNPVIFGDKELTCSKKIADGFCKFFASESNFKVRKANGRPDVDKRSTCYNKDEMELFEGPLTAEELDVALRETNVGRSPGPDGILPDFLVHMGTSAKKTVLKLFNLIWDRHYPAPWRKAEVVPILKKKKPANLPGNYRPISLTSSLSKVFERIVVKRLKIYLEKYELLSNNQAGFRSHRSTIEQVAHFTQEVKDGFQRKQHTLAVFVDFKSAFNRVWRKKLLSKLVNLKVGGKLYASLESFLAQRFIRAKYEYCTSTFRQIKQGLPQGSVLSPTLFNIMIDDLAVTLESIPGINVLLYADDLAIWATSSSTSALEEHLNNALNLLHDWTEENEMVVSTTKSEYELFTMSTKQYPISLKYNKEELPRTDKATYLGVKLDTKLNWGEHIGALVEKGESRLKLLKRLAGTKWGASQDVLQLAYKSYVRPALEYGSEVIVTASTTALNKLEKQQNKALRLITGGPRSTPIPALQLQAEVEPLHSRRDMACLVLHERVLRTHSQYWSIYKAPKQRLKTQKTFTAKAKEVAERLQVKFPEREKFFRLESVNRQRQVQCNLQLIQPVKKGETPEWELKAITLETINSCYPLPKWFHVYSDGSARDAKCDAGAGVYSDAFQLSAPVGRVASNYDGELAAISMAASKVRDGPWENVVIFVDSKAALISAAGIGCAQAGEEMKCRKAVDAAIRAGKNIVLQWIPGHCGIYGNDEADRLAKIGANMCQPEQPVSMQTAKRIIIASHQSEVNKMQKVKAEGSRWKSLVDPHGRIPSDLPRRDGVACFRLLTGHDYLQAHLHRIGVVPDPTCVLCGREPMTADHLDTCPSLEDIRCDLNIDIYRKRSEIYWAARRRMAELPRPTEGVD